MHQRAKRFLGDPAAWRTAAASRLAGLWTSAGQRAGRTATADVRRRELRHDVLDTIAGDVAHVVLVLGRNAEAIANDVASALPGAAVHLLSVRDLDPRQPARLRPNVRYHPCRSIADRVAYLSRHPQPQLIIEHGNNTREQKLACFVQLFPFVAVGGRYIVEALDSVTAGESGQRTPNVLELLREVDRLCASGNPADEAPARTLELARAAAGVEFRDDAAIVQKAKAHQFKIRDRDANSLLGARFEHSWGEVVRQRPAGQWRPDVRFFAHGDGPVLADKSVIDLPERYLRRYRSASAWPQQRLRHGDYWLPDTFRHSLDTALGHRYLINPTSDMARLDDGAVGPTRSVDGPLFYFDTEFPAQFGHVLSEVVSRHWGWESAKEVQPSIRPLLSLHPSARDIPNFQRSVFSALGIDLETAELIGPGECVEVSDLYAATPDFVMPQYAAPELAGVWNTISRSCGRPDEPGGPRRLFVSRRSKGIRTCLNTAEVEAMFLRIGFEIIYPEDFDFRTQVTKFRHARVIAGFGGSGMFNTMFAPHATVLVISGNSYRANNEYLIRAVVGGDVHYFWGDSLIKTPRGGWTWAAYQSNFTFDVARFEPEIADISATAEARS